MASKSTNTGEVLASTEVDLPSLGGVVPRPKIDFLKGPADPLSGVARTAAAIQAGELSAVEAVAECLRRIGTPEATSLGAFITIDGDAALEDARRRDQEGRGRGDVGPLHGVPVAIKDNLATAGLRTTAGTALFADWVPSVDADAVAALRAAGAVVLGKTNMHEAAFGITCKNDHYGAVRNPYDPDRIPGGSSGGSAAAVAAGLCPGSLGTDTGGSIRIPAALCGLVGFKPSIGRVSTQGLIALSRTCDVIGPIVPSVRDAEIMFAALGGDSSPPSKAPRPADIAGVRLARLVGYFAGTASDVDSLVSRFVGRLADNGAVVSETVVDGAEQATAAGFDIVVPEAWALLSAQLSEVSPGVELESRLELLGPDVRMALSAGGGGKSGSVTACSYLRALWQVRPALQKAFVNAFRNVEFLVCATTPTTAVGRDQDPEMILEGQLVSTFDTFIRHCSLVSVAGLPAITLPVGVSPEGLPVGVQIIARYGQDQRLLFFAEACEAMFGSGQELG